jgi:uncharacterized membrane protein HdeD (DUF308 family)
MLTQEQKQRQTLFKTLLWGLLVIGLYTALYFSENILIRWTAQGEWTFFIPIIIAFVFSFAHGHFTGEFWELLGVKPKRFGGK